jgi:hypothetical protein
MMLTNQFRCIERIFVASNEHAAEIIGLGGYKIKNIARETNTFISCPSPVQAPIFEIFGKCRKNVLIAKKLIQSHANHFDEMRRKKRKICLESEDDEIQTIAFEKNDIPFIIGRKGHQIKKIMRTSQVKIISPDTNKFPIFIITGLEDNIKKCVFWMKLTAFVANGRHYFSPREVKTLYNYTHRVSDHLSLQMHQMVNTRLLRERLKHMNIEANFSNEGVAVTSNDCKKFWNCWKCKSNCERVALALCGHKISCHKCIQFLFRDIYLKCFYCEAKIESFIIHVL